MLTLEVLSAQDFSNKNVFIVLFRTMRAQLVVNNSFRLFFNIFTHLPIESKNTTVSSRLVLNQFLAKYSLIVSHFIAVSSKSFLHFMKPENFESQVKTSKSVPALPSLFYCERSDNFETMSARFALSTMVWCDRLE